MSQACVTFVDFFNCQGVEGHTVVRDYFTSRYENNPTFPIKSDCVLVDAIVNTIGFPLVGGPAGYGRR